MRSLINAVPRYTQRAAAVAGNAGLTGAAIGVAILAATGVGAAAQDDPANQAPKPTLADVQHIAEAIATNKSKLQAYCELGRLHDETQQAVEDNDLEAIGVLTAKAYALEQQLGPEYDNVIDGLDKVDLSSAEGQELVIKVSANPGDSKIRQPLALLVRSKSDHPLKGAPEPLCGPASATSSLGASAINGCSRCMMRRLIRWMFRLVWCRSPMLRTHKPLTSNSRPTSFRNGSSRCFRYRPSPTRRRCANLILSTRTARHRALTRAASNENPFRTPFDALLISDPAPGLAPMISLPNFRVFLGPYAAAAFHTIVT
jgi:hypothetical protein